MTITIDEIQGDYALTSQVQYPGGTMDVKNLKVNGPYNIDNLSLDKSNNELEATLVVDGPNRTMSGDYVVKGDVVVWVGDIMVPNPQPHLDSFSIVFQKNAAGDIYFSGASVQGANGSSGLPSPWFGNKSS